MNARQFLHSMQSTLRTQLMHAANAPWIFVAVLTLALLLNAAGSITQAKELNQIARPPTQIEAGPGAKPNSTFWSFPIQGRLATATGNPVANGNYSITASFYTAATGGTAICSDTQTVAVTQGLFSMAISACAGLLESNAGLVPNIYMGIKVESDAEMTPRQLISAVPFANSLPHFATLAGSVNQPEGSSFGGLVKAGVFATCSNTASSLIRSFRTQFSFAPLITVSNGSTVGLCHITFADVDLSARYWVSTPVTQDPGRTVTCSVGVPGDLVCKHYNAAFNLLENGDIMVLIY